MATLFAAQYLPNIRAADVEFPAYIAVTPSLFAQATDLKHIFFGKFGATASFAKGMSFFAYLVLYVVLLCSKKQMGGITTWGIVAMVEAMQVIGNGFIVKLPRRAMGIVHLPAVIHKAISRGRGCALPFPAFVFVVRGAISPEVISKRSVNRRSFVVTSDKANRLAFYPTSTRSVVFGNLGFAATSTVAITIFNFIKGKLGLGKFWSMLIHVICSLVASGRAPGLLQAIAGAFRVVLHPYYSTEVLEIGG